MMIGQWLEPGAVALRLRADSKRQIMAALAEIASRSFGIAAPVLLDSLLAREANGSTGMGDGVALPHARVAGLDRLRSVFLRLEAPVAFDAVDGQPVDLIYGLFGPEGGDLEHLRALARASRALRSRELREQLRRARTTDAICALLGQHASPSAA